MLILGFFFLFDTFITAGDFFARVIGSNVYTNQPGEVRDKIKTWLALFIPVAVGLIPFLYDPALLGKDPTMGAAAIVIGLLNGLAITGVSAFSATELWSYKKTCYAIVTIFYAMGLAQLFLKKPGPLIFLTVVRSMFIMVLACWVLLYLNWFLLPKIHPAGKPVRPNWIHFVILLGISIVFIYTFVWYLSLIFEF